MDNKTSRKLNKGIIVTYVLVFGAIFIILLSGLLSFILLQSKQSDQKLAWQESLEIAEAGINYYRWCLNNEIEANCLLEKEYTDSAGNPIGRFSLEVIPRMSCGEALERSIVSTGWTYDFPDVERKISVLYAKTPVAEYAYLLNYNVWAGSDREIRGLYHSNGGIRMDGENQSLITSAQPTWLCTDSFGCSPSEEKPGVFTTTENSNPGLFEFPVPSFDFDGITIDLAQIKELTSYSPQEYYWPPASDLDDEGKGYHLKFINDGTFEIWIITELSSDWAYNEEEDWHNDYFEIESEYKYGSSITIDPDCSLIFVEDNLWLEGKVKGKVTVASADLINPNGDTDVILTGNIDYTALDGSDGLSVIGERNILISPESPEVMEIRGIFIAQKGRFGRNLYWGNIKDRLEVFGSVISNGRVGTQWESGSLIVSGYLKRENYIDPNLIYSPPPFVPYTGSEFSIFDWEELE
jgi:hypothetical protein